jgi:hypothetical protein
MMGDKFASRLVSRATELCSKRESEAGVATENEVVNEAD